jgi:drug/metabolite transporter (DMT)-like permease
MASPGQTAAAGATGPSMAPAYLALAAAALFWGGNWVLARWIQNQFPPQTLSLLRWGSAALFLLPFAIAPTLRVWGQVRAEWKRLAILGAIGVTGFSSLSYAGLSFTTSINGSLLNTAAPVFIMILAAMGFGERITLAEVAGVAVSIVGVVVIIARGSLETLAAMRVNAGDAIVMLAVLLWAVYTVLLRRWRIQLPPMVFLFTTIVLSLPLPMATTALEYALGAPAPSPDTIGWMTIVYLGLFPSIGAYACWNFGVSRAGAARATLFQYLIPVFAAALAVTLLGEEIRLFHIAGAALIVGGLLLATRAKAR